MAVDFNTNVNSASYVNRANWSAGNAAAAKAAENTEAKKPEAQDGVVYEKSSGAAEKKPTYSINQKSQSDRSAIVAKMKADAENRASQMTNIVQKMMNGQAKANSLATGDDSIWKFLAKGDFKADPATIAQAKEDIGEDGYWGVKQTSQRLFDFASALAGDDEEKMKKMQSAIEKGYNQATKAWGGNLPSISQDTMSATNKLFDDYYASKKAAGVEE